jgi:lysine decarboxylase
LLPLPDHRHERAPYFEALQAHLKEDVGSFHVPGHQGGRGVDQALSEFLGPKVWRADLTEVLGIDDLHRPTAQVKEAQALAAAAFGAEQTHFLINGSTSGNHAMLLATTGPGDVVLMPRNAHRSLWGGLLLSGASAAVYQPPFDSELGVYRVATPACVEAAVIGCPAAQCFVLSSPSYHGHAADTVGVVQKAHDLGLMVLADEAWGAHLAFHCGFPTSAVHAGADLTVQSTHKMLPALTQSAMLHVRGDRVDRARLDLVLRTILSSSPSALLVASLDVARRQFALHGRRILDDLAGLAARARDDLNALEGISCWGGELQPKGAVSFRDPTRLVVSALLRGHTGYELEAFLRHEHRLQIEMPDLFGVVVVLTAGHTQEHLGSLVKAVDALPRQASSLDVKGFQLAPPTFSDAVFTPRDALHSPTERVPFQRAAGRRAAETVTLYPPGIPWLLPGERIVDEVLDQLKARQRAGGNIQGATDPSLETIRVLV